MRLFNRVKKEEWALLKQKKVLRLPFFDVYISSVKTDKPKVAVVVSKKISKKAVERNRIRRRVIAMFEKFDLDDRVYVVHPKKEVLDVKFDELINSAKSHFNNK